MHNVIMNDDLHGYIENLEIDETYGGPAGMSPSVIDKSS